MKTIVIIKEPKKHLRLSKVFESYWAALNGLKDVLHDDLAKKYLKEKGFSKNPDIEIRKATKYEIELDDEA